MRDELDPVLAKIYAAEKSAPLPTGAAARVLAGALTTVAASPVAAAASTGVAAKFSMKLLLAATLASAVGGMAITYVVIAPKAHIAPTVTPNEEPPVVVIALPDAAIATIDAMPNVDAAPVPVPRVAHAPVVPTAAPRRGLLDDALTTLMRHAREFPDGALAEERDVLLIEGYLQRGDLAIVRRRIDAYRSAYPSGLLRNRVDTAAATLR